MITIEPDQTILNDSNKIGTIVDGVAVLDAAVNNVIKGAIRKAAGNPSLAFQSPPSEGTDATEGTSEGTSDTATPEAPADSPDDVSPYGVPVGQDPRLGTKTPGWKKR